ncbi:MAG: hypothetical protein LBD58_08565 [Treponema sp.]|jgi:chromosome segregation ATPase|nr:hypothetical protein [Treponema sp.]
MRSETFYAIILLCLCGCTSALLLLSLTPPPQASGRPLNNSGPHSQTWERLSAQFEEALRRREETLRRLSEKLKISEGNGGRLTSLLDESLRQNENLKAYNEQMARRMQERDEDLAAASAEIEKVKKQRDKVALAIAVAAASVCAYIAIAKRS